MPDWIDQLETQFDERTPEYVPSLLAEIRVLRIELAAARAEIADLEAVPVDVEIDQAFQAIEFMNAKIQQWVTAHPADVPAPLAEHLANLQWVLHGSTH